MSKKIYIYKGERFSVERFNKQLIVSDGVHDVYVEPKEKERGGPSVYQIRFGTVVYSGGRDMKHTMDAACSFISLARKQDEVAKLSKDKVWSAISAFYDRLEQA